MKVVSIVVVATMLLAVTEAQFSLSNLFSGLRPLFSRPRTRVRPRQRPQTIFVPAGQFLSQNEQSNFIPQASPATSFIPVGQDVFQQPRIPPASEPRPPAITTRPPPPPRTPQPSPPRTPQPSPRPSSPRPTQQAPPQSQGFIQRPQSPPRQLSNNGREFGAPKPESVISTSVPVQQSPVPGQQSSPPVHIFSDENRIEEQSSQILLSQREQSSIFKVTGANQGLQVESFPNPLPRQNDNNIIGMLPPPLPSSSTTTSTSTSTSTITTTTTGTGAVIVTLPSSSTTAVTRPVLVTQPPLFSISSSLAPLTSITQVNSQARENIPQSVGIVTSGPDTNAIETVSLSQNPVPHVNAGVLPLADISKEPQFFPPFNQISVESFNSEREQRELFPPFGFKDEAN